MHSDNDVLNPDRQVRAAPASRGLPDLVVELEQGTQSSNTVPSTSMGYPHTRVLRSGIDSLYLTYRGELYTDAVIRLNKLKEMAQADRDSMSCLAQLPINNHVFEVSGNGRNPFAYVLRDGWFRIELAKAEAKLIPLAYCQVASELLTTLGAELAVADLGKTISEIGSISDFPNVSRVDLCVDFITDFPIANIKISEWVGKPRDFSEHTVGREFSGISVAPGGVISARLYNKTLELKKRPRPYLEDLWRKQGWDGEKTVWRVEFQFMRQCLRDLQIVKYTDLVGSVAGLWGYATQEWLRHTVPIPTDQTQSRWPSSPVWAVLQAVPWGGVDKLERISLERTRIPSDKSLFINGLSSLTSFMAREGYQDAEKAISAFLIAAQDYHNSQASLSGIDFDNYVLGKVTSKQRYYNTCRNMPHSNDTHPADKAVAAEYRKQSDGEY